MKQTRTQFRLGIALASLLLGSTGAATAQYLVDSFDTGTQGSMVPGGNIWWGSSTMTWDGTQDATGNSGGSGYITCTFSSASDTPCMADITLGLGGNNPWWCPIAVDLTAYIAMDFDIKWDTTASNMSVDQFNNPSTFDAGITGSFNGMEFMVFDNNPTRIAIGIYQLTNTAMAGWEHMSVPINPATPGISNTRGVAFHKWFAGAPAGTGISAFWIDNILFKSNNIIPPPPTLSVRPAPQGLNLFAATTGQYDREMIEIQPGTGVFTWLGGSDATYSFTISKFEAPAPGQQAHIFLINMTSGDDVGTSPDWNKENVIFVTLQNQVETNGDPYYIFQFSYKTNQPSGNSMIFSSNLNYGKCITNSSAIGTWAFTFTSDTTVHMTGPGGLSTNFVAFDQDSANLFTDPIAVYFGMQANNPANVGIGHVVFTQVSVTGSSVTTVTDNFSSNPSIASPVGPNGSYAGINTNVWVTRMGSSAAGQNIPANAYFLNWDLPDTGFKLATNSDITNPAGWGTTNLPLKWQVGTTNYVTLTANANYDIYQVPGTALDSTGTNSYATNYWYHYPLAYPGSGNQFIGLKK
ncbi:MAG: hypothetical protein U1F98_05810 [Verrucomicrobiota bacterium]